MAQYCQEHNEIMQKYITLILNRVYYHNNNTIFLRLKCTLRPIQFIFYFVYLLRNCMSVATKFLTFVYFTVYVRAEQHLLYIMYLNNLYKYLKCI